MGAPVQEEAVLSHALWPWEAETPSKANAKAWEMYITGVHIGTETNNHHVMPTPCPGPYLAALRMGSGPLVLAFFLMLSTEGLCSW